MILYHKQYIIKPNYFCVFKSDAIKQTAILLKFLTQTNRKTQ